MITPSCERIQELAKDYTVIPICKEIYADVVTPITLLRRLAKNSKQYYLLESVEGGEKWGRYSLLADMIDSGKAYAKLEEFCQFNHEVMQ